MFNLGNFIKEQRKINNLTQKDLALMSGLGLRFIREVEQGKETCRMDKVRELLNFFGYDFCAINKNGDVYES